MSGSSFSSAKKPLLLGDVNRRHRVRDDRNRHFHFSWGLRVNGQQSAEAPERRSAYNYHQPFHKHLSLF